MSEAAAVADAFGASGAPRTSHCAYIIVPPTTTGARLATSPIAEAAAHHAPADQGFDASATSTRWWRTLSCSAGDGLFEPTSRPR